MANIEALIEAFDEPILLVADNRLTAANAAARAIVGQRMVGSDLRLAIRHPAILELISAGQPASLDAEGFGRVDRPWRVHVVPLGKGEMLVRFVDRAAARAAEKMRVDFVANASHELRTPLATLLGYSETLAEAGDMDEDTRTAFAKTMRSEAQRMLRIIEDLMGLSRIEADRFVSPRRLIDLGALLKEAAANNQELAQRRNCMMSMNIDPDLPQIAGDWGQISQLLDNLIANAIRYGCTPDKCAVDLSLYRHQGRVRLEVRDYGDGIAPEHLPRLTERFYRVDPARSRESGGTGLGLAIVKHIAERHRASLDIASAVGNGTRVTIDFPVPA